MISLNWPLVVLITAGLYIGAIVFLPFNVQTASLMLFAIIAFWSRLPGVGIPHPFFIIYSLDLVDVFTLLVAINIGSFQGALFTIFCNLGSRLVGVYPGWDGVMFDALFQSILAFICPFIYSVTGNLLLTMTCFTVLREIMFFSLWFVYPRWSFAQEIVKTLTCGGIVFLANTFYTKLFGDFFLNAIEKGVAFNWVLFIFATIVILVFGIAVFGLSPSKAMKKAGGNVKAIISHQLKMRQEPGLREDKADVEMMDEIRKNI